MPAPARPRPEHPTRPRRTLALTLAAATLTTAAACGTPASTGSSPGGLTRVNVAVVSIADGSTFFVALRHGYFTQAGLDVHYTTMPQSTAAMPALLAGRIDVIGAANYVSAFESQIHGAASIRVLAEDGECGAPAPIPSWSCRTQGSPRPPAWPAKRSRPTSPGTSSSS
jgi:ABC-type phosphate/phosphonate transport system substrate-binding protein